MTAPAIVVLDTGGGALARRLATLVPGAAIHAPPSAEAAVHFDGFAAHLRALFAAGTPIIGVCAAGIAIRALAPLLDDKHAEPPVVVVSPDGAAVVPLLGGHHGANTLARTLARGLGVHAAVTTASDRRLGFALDAPPPGWRVAPGARVKTVTAALLRDAPVRLVVEAGNADWLTAGRAILSDDGEREIRVTDSTRRSSDVVLHPGVLALGIGCERGANADAVIALVARALERAGLSPLAVACVGSLDLKADEPAILAAADHFGVPLRFFDAARLEEETPRLANPSDVVFQAVGCHGVAEAAALACAGDAAVLAVEKQRGARATCAIARAPDVIDPSLVGRGRGRVTVVGLGPGAPGWRTPAAAAALSGATDLVGYGLYLDQIGARADQTRHAFPLGAEADRVQHALALAASGRRVALVSSGDAGIYGMASLLLEALSSHPAARRMEITLEPGISAMQAAAARAGAPLGHDFCAISLSDLLTARETIERRLTAAAEADFVVALYNPASRSRRDLLQSALSILRAHRPATCPVVVARNVGRPGESVSITTLAALDVATIDMLTIVIIGATTSQTIGQTDCHWVYTPRGYDTVADRPSRAARAR